MPISNTQIRKSYVGDGVSKQFAITFPFYLDTDITVLLGAAEQSSGYSITGGEDANGNPQTGTVIFSSAPARDIAVQVILDVPLTQLVQLVDGTEFPSATLNQVNDRAIQAALRLSDLLDRAILAPDGDVSPNLSLPPASVRANTYPTFDSIGNLSIAQTLPSGTLSQATIGLFLQPKTDAEISAGVTPTNYAYAPGIVERYGSNTTPGTTSMTAAMQAAINVAKKGGNGGVVIIGTSGPYLIDGALDLTAPVGTVYSGMTLRGVGNANPAASSPSAVIVLQHNATAFDCTGTVGITFENLTLQTGSPYPKIGFLLARNTDARSQTMRFNNVQVIGSFSQALVYNYGSEDDQYTACSFYNRAADANSCTMYFTSRNILGITSAFTTIATGTQSTIDHKIIGGEIAHLGGQTTTDTVRFESISSAKFIGSWMAIPSGRALFYVQTVNGPTNLITLFGITGENQPGNYGILFDGAGTNTSSYWAILSCTFPNNSFALASQSNTTLDDFHIKQLSNQGIGGGISIAATLQNSHIDELGLSGVAVSIGTSTGNILHVSIPNLSVTTRSGDMWFGPGVQTWTPNTSAWTVTGALTISNRRVQYNASEVTVTADFSAATSIVCSQGTALGGLPVANVVDSALVIFTNRNTGVIIGTGQLSGTSILCPAINVGAGVVVTMTAKYFCA